MYVKPLTYAYNSQGHRVTNLPLFGLVLSRQPPGPTTVDSRTSLPTDATATTAPQVLRARLILRVAPVRQDTDRGINSSLQRYENDHNRRTRNAPQTFTTRQYVYIDWPSMTTSAGERLVPNS